MESVERGLQLPIINIAPYLNEAHSPASNAERGAVSRALHSACVKYGFFYLDVAQYIEPAEAEELTRLARSFFALPQAEKDKISLKHQDFARGYQRLKENVTNGKADNHEGIDFYKPVENPDKSQPLWGENQWPAVPGFQTKYEQWIEKMKKLGMILMEAMAYGLGMNGEEWDELRAQVDDSFWDRDVQRYQISNPVGYPPLPDDHDGFSCGAHKDYGCLTLLYADPTKSALQVFLRKRGHVPETLDGLPEEHGSEEGFWINADPIPGCIVCNIGEMWETWTNGLYKSTLHRVVHRGANYRVSIPFFFEPNFAAHIKPLPAALRATAEEGDTPGKVYTPVIYGDFLKRKVGSNFTIDGRERYA